MKKSEKRSQYHGRRPEADSFCQRVQRIPSQQVFFSQCDKNERDAPGARPVKDLAIVQRQLSKIKCMHRSQGHKQQSERQKAPENITTHESRKHVRVPERQAILPHVTALNAAHDPAPKHHNQEFKRTCESYGRRGQALRKPTGKGPEQKSNSYEYREYDRQKNQQAPSRPQAALVEEYEFDVVSFPARSG